MIEQQEKVIPALMMVVVIKMEMRTMAMVMALVMTVVTTIDDNGSCDGFGGFVCDDGW